MVVAEKSRKTTNRSLTCFRLCIRPNSNSYPGLCKVLTHYQPQLQARTVCAPWTEIAWCSLAEREGLFVWVTGLRHPLHLALRLWSAGRRVTLASGAVVFGAGDSHGAMSFARRERGRFVGCSGFAVFCFAASALGALGVLAAFAALHARRVIKQKKPAWMRAICLVAGAGFEPAAFRL